MFLYGMQVMSDGLQKSTGERMRKALNLMAGNRFVGVLTGFLVTAIVQSSSAVSVMVVSFVNAGLLSLVQSIGVLFGANIGTTMTAWIIGLIGFKISIDSLAVPAIGIGFLLKIIKWKYKAIGEFIFGFGFLFLGLYYLANEMGKINEVINFDAITAFKDMGFIAILIGFGTSILMTVLINSSTAAVTIIMTMAVNNIITYEMAVGMILGANIGTTTDGLLASINGTIEAKRAAWTHVLFNVLGSCWALPLLKPLLGLIDFLVPGNPYLEIPLHLAMLHTMFKVINTIIFLPFINQYARFVTWLIRSKKTDAAVLTRYTFTPISSGNVNSAELNIIRAEKEVKDMARIVSSMYSSFCVVLRGLQEKNGKDEENTAALCAELKKKEDYIDDMREVLSNFFIECTSMNTNTRMESRISYLLQVIVALESMSDECLGLSYLLDKSVGKKCVFKDKEMDQLIPYVGQVEKFLALLDNQFGVKPSPEQKLKTMELEEKIDKKRKKLHKLGRKRIEAGENVKAELLFIELVRRIEKLGDYCYEIAEAHK